MQPYKDKINIETEYMMIYNIINEITYDNTIGLIPVGLYDYVLR